MLSLKFPRIISHLHLSAILRNALYHQLCWLGKTGVIAILGKYLDKKKWVIRRWKNYVDFSYDHLVANGVF